MQRAYLVFDYFKEAFHINRNNKRIYLPQISLIIIKSLIILTIGISIYNWFYSWIGSFSLYSIADQKILTSVLAKSVKLLLILLSYSIMAITVESGLYNMYKSCVFGTGLQQGDFSLGVKKYFFKLLLINLLIIAVSIVLLPLLMIFGFVTIFVGFIIIPILIMLSMVFITFWKISMVVNDSSIFPALKDSFSFVRRCFFSLAFMQLIHWAMVGGISGQSGASISNVGGMSDTSHYNPGSYFSLEFVEKIIRIALLVLIPVITISTFISSLIKMLFDVFFSLSFFVAYKNKFITDDLIEWEVPNDVV